jgi:integrase
MGSIRKRGGKYYAEISKNGKRKGKTCATKSEAMQWIVAAEKEASSDSIPDKTLGELLTRYAETVSPGKKSHKREINRINALLKDPLSKVKIADLDAPAIVEWRDRRLIKIKANSVRRDWVVLNHACNIAITEWQWLRVNPFKSVKKPPPGEDRSRVITQDEIDAILHTCGYGSGTLTAQVGAVMLFALETAMRIGEICGLTWENVHDRHVHIPFTKNGSARDVPLSKKARELIKNQSKENPVFDLTVSQADSLWRKCRDRAMIENLHFHDTRRTALTRLAKKFSVMDLAKISGHRDLRILQNVYYAPTIDDLADQLD